jgi:hypothetical protein
MASRDKLERKEEFNSNGQDFEWLVGGIAHLLDMAPDEVLKPGCYPQFQRAASNGVR